MLLEPAVDGPPDRLQNLRLLASALSGRPLEVSATAPGERAWTDGATVYLDPSSDGTTLQQALAVQALLLRAGSLDPDIVKQLRRNRKLTQRYLAIEGHRAVAEAGDLPPDIVSCIVDASIATLSESPTDSLRLALQERGRTTVPGVFGDIHPRRIIEVAEAAPTLQLEPDEQHRPTPTKLEVIDDEDVGDDGGDIGHLLQSPVGGGGAVGKLLQRLTSPTRSKGKGGGPVGADSPTHVGRVGEPGRGVVTEHRLITDVESADVPDPSVGTRYPEWDERRGSYRVDWCTVIEVAPKPEDRRALASVGDLGLRRPLARLGVGLQRQRRMTQGDDIDIDAVVDARVQAAADGAVPDGVYVETLRRRRDLSVLVLLDVSGSAGEPAPGAKTVHDHQRAAAAGLMSALAELGDRVALYGFNSRGRSAVQVMQVKRFDDHLDNGVYLDLGGLSPAGYTRVGAAVRHGASVLTTTGGTPRRLLVVISDGFAYDSGYEGAYGEADARRALTEARRSGVGCVCLSVGANTDPVALRRVFGSAAHASVPTARQLSGVVAPLFASAMRSAEAERREFQRSDRTRERLEMERLSA